MSRSTIGDILQDVVEARSAVDQAQSLKDVAVDMLRKAVMDVETLRSKVVDVRAEQSRKPCMPGFEDDLPIYIDLLQSAEPTVMGAEAALEAAKNTLRLANNRYARLQAGIEMMKSTGEWERRDEADRARLAGQRHQQMRKEPGPFPRPVETSLLQAPVTISISIEQWRHEANVAFANYANLQAFPQPPVRSRSLTTCSCNIRAAFMELPFLNLKTERRRWHPDRFSASPAQHRVVFQQMAMEVFVVIDAMYNEQK
ncbi:hypothetical protein PRZ48_014972 [Zasmidium cellare]|uniref:Uncharacterized protein n=1 Tax=Zasmidium cellare TaxID=395010 RepID=A0ABR0DXA6_ZASCE|nr:hypothetical protein PRZ48_014972 [Zasmidium cellare]